MKYLPKTREEAVGKLLTHNKDSWAQYVTTLKGTALSGPVAYSNHHTPYISNIRTDELRGHDVTWYSTLEELVEAEGDNPCVIALLEHLI